MHFLVIIKICTICMKKITSNILCCLVLHNTNYTSTPTYYFQSNIKLGRKGEGICHCLLQNILTKLILTGLMLAIENDLKTGLLFFLVVNKEWYPYYIIQSTKHKQQK